MAKLSLINREKKRQDVVAKFAAKRAELQAIVDDASKSFDERLAARQQIQQLPRNSSPTRLRKRCAITGRPRGTFRRFGLSRSKIRELAFRGEIPGVTKSSW